MLILLVSGALAWLGCSRSQQGHTYSSWDSMEADKFASAWLIKRFVDSQAEFKFYPVGQLISDGIPFDTPDAEIRRYHNMSTFEFVLKKYKIEDRGLAKIGQIMHELEIISWQGNLSDDAQKLDRDIKEIVKANQSMDACLAECMRFFDDYYGRLGKGAER